MAVASCGGTGSTGAGGCGGGCTVHCKKCSVYHTPFWLHTYGV